MSANLDLQKVNEWEGLRGFSNLFNKENRAWWGTRRWWIIALVWTVVLCGLTAIMLFGPNEELAQASPTEVTQAGGELAFILSVGLSIFLQFGIPMLGIGTILLAQDLIIGEKQNGVAEWLLSKPVVRRSYVLAKLAANVFPVLVLLVGLPSLISYAILSLRLGAPFPPSPYLASVGIMALHTLFYLAFTLMLGTIFNNRVIILGIALGSVLGGGILGGFIKPLLYITPWILPNVALATATAQSGLENIGYAAIASTTAWIGTFIFVAIKKFEKMEY